VPPRPSEEIDLGSSVRVGVACRGFAQRRQGWSDILLAGDIGAGPIGVRAGPLSGRSFAWRGGQRAIAASLGPPVSRWPPWPEPLWQ
jgi:hypothetical protein